MPAPQLLLQLSRRPRAAMAAMVGRALAAAVLQMLTLAAGTAAALLALYGTLWLSS